MVLLIILGSALVVGLWTWRFVVHGPWRVKVVQVQQGRDDAAVEVRIARPWRIGVLVERLPSSGWGEGLEHFHAAVSEARTRAAAANVAIGKTPRRLRG